MWFLNKKREKRHQAYALVEILVVSVIVLVVVVIANVSLIQEYRLRKVSDINSELHLTGRRVMDFLTAELRNATRTVASSPPDIFIPTEKTSIVFYLPQLGVIDANGNTAWDLANPIQYQFDPSLKQLLRSEAGETRVLAGNVSSIEFNDIATDVSLYANELRVDLVLEKSLALGQTASVVFVSTIKMRN